MECPKIHVVFKHDWVKCENLIIVFIVLKKNETHKKKHAALSYKAITPQKGIVRSVCNRRSTSFNILAPHYSQLLRRVIDGESAAENGRTERLSLLQRLRNTRHLCFFLFFFFLPECCSHAASSSGAEDIEEIRQPLLSTMLTYTFVTVYHKTFPFAHHSNNFHVIT